MSDPISLSQGDWEEIYYALESKRHSLREEGPILQSQTEHDRFVSHLGGIMQRIGADGKKAAREGVAPVKDAAPVT